MLHGTRPGSEGQLGMLALARLKARLAPERGLDARPPTRVAPPRLVPGIGATAAPAPLERKPGATRHPLHPPLFRPPPFPTRSFLHVSHRPTLLAPAPLPLA